MNTRLLAYVSGDSLVHNLLILLVVVICVAAIYFVGKWFLQRLTAGPTALMVWDGVFILIGLIFVINFLLSLIGRPFIQW